MHKYFEDKIVQDSKENSPIVSIGVYQAVAPIGKRLSDSIAEMTDVWFPDCVEYIQPVKGIAKCLPDDQFSRKTGINVATTKARLKGAKIAQKENKRLIADFQAVIRKLQALDSELDDEIEMLNTRLEKF